MERRHFLKTTLASSVVAMPALRTRKSDDPEIIKVELYQPPAPGRPIMVQSKNVVVVTCSNGLQGVGEGGSPDTISNVGGWLIGQDPFRTDHLWQLMLRGYFYPGGRELQHAIGGLDIALWDLKGKLLGQPIYQLAGGLSRDYLELYATGYPRRGTLTETARHCVEAGFRAFRTHGKANTGTFDVHTAVREDYDHCRDIYEGVEGRGDWAIDLHTRYDRATAVRLANMLEELQPLFIEDLIRSENQDLYRLIRQQTAVPIALGEQFGFRWDFHKLIEDDLMDYCRVSLPNCAGITEYLKIMAMCETHYVGMVPHFTGPIATAALTQCLAAYPGVVVMEMRGERPSPEAHLNSDYLIFRAGKLYPSAAPGHGVSVSLSSCVKLCEVTEPKNYEFPALRRPDGSFTNW